MMKHEEHALQCVIVRYLLLNNVYCFAIPNGGRRDAREGARLKKEGVLAGVTDIGIVLYDEVFFIEIKTPTGRQSKSQKDFQENVERLNHQYQIWRSLDDAINFVANRESGVICE